MRYYKHYNCLQDHSLNNIYKQKTLMQIVFNALQRKCDQYWPSEGETTYGHTHVKITNTFVTAHYTVRVFSLRQSRDRVSVVKKVSNRTNEQQQTILQLKENKINSMLKLLVPPLKKSHLLFSNKIPILYTLNLAYYFLMMHPKLPFLKLTTCLFYKKTIKLQFLYKTQTVIS